MFTLTRTPTGITWVRCTRCSADVAARDDKAIARWKIAHTRQCPDQRRAS